MNVFAQTTRILACGLLSIVPWQFAAAQSNQTRRLSAPIQGLPHLCRGPRGSKPVSAAKASTGESFRAFGERQVSVNRD